MSEFNIGTLKFKTPILEEDGLLEVDIENGCGYENISLEQAKALVEFLNEKINMEESKLHLPLGTEVEPLDYNKNPFKYGTITGVNYAFHTATISFINENNKQYEIITVPLKNLNLNLNNHATK